MAVVDTRAIRLTRDLLDRRQAVIIAAPVGFGKTTTARAAVELRPNVVWYGAQSWERDAFAEALVDAVRTIRPDFGRLTLGLAGQGAGGARLGAGFAKDLTHVHDALTIVVDDAHLLWEGENFTAFLDVVLARAPEYVTFLLISRTEPHFNVMELVAAERAALIVARDLRFTRDDAAAFVRASALDMRVADVDRVVDELDGWPAGVALTFRFGARELPTGHGTLDAVSSYLLERVIGTIPAQSIASLESLSVLETIDLPLFGAPQRDTLRRQLSDLESNGALVAAVQTGERYRVHPLLRDAIRKRVQARDGDGAIASLHESAARLYASARRTGPALYHLNKAGRDSASVWFLRTCADDAIGSGHGEALRALNARLRAAGCDDPVLDYVSGLLAKFRGGDSTLRAAFERARDRALHDGDETIAYLSEVQLVEHDLGRGRPVNVALIADLGKRALRRSPMEGALAAIRAGWYEAINGRFAAALEAVADVPDDGSSVAAFNLVPLRAYAHTSLGEFETATALVAALLERLSNGETIVLYASGLLWASRFAMLRGDTGEAYHYAAEARRIGEPFDLRHEGAALHAALAEAAIHAGDPVTAAESAALAGRFSNDAWYKRDAERAASLSKLYEARAAFLTGATQRAHEIAMHEASHAATPLLRALARVDEFVFSNLQGRRANGSIGMRLLSELESHVPADAADAVSLQSAAELLAFFEALESGSEPASIVWTHPFTALLERRQGSARLAVIGLALRNFRSAAASGNGLAAGVRIFTARGPRYEIAVVRAAARARGFDDALSLDGLSAGSAAARTPLVEALTPRESDILVLLAQGLTNKEMAQRLILGSRTVETHVARILGKLGVNTRARAVARALEMGLAAP